MSSINLETMETERVQKAMKALDEFLERIAFLKEEVKQLTDDADFYQMRADSLLDDAAFCRQELSMCKEIAERIKASLDDIYLYNDWEERIMPSS
jgi:uncharacterized coiled-coil DUF342 family protein